MKPVHVLLLGLGVLLVADTARGKHQLPRTREPRCPNAASQGSRRGASKLTSLVSDLQAAHRQDGSGTGQSAGNLWIEVSRLKREGRNVRTIEWYVSDLEGSLRRGQPDASARRHILNNLSYEVERLNHRQP